MDQFECNRLKDFERIKDVIKQQLNWSGHLYPDFDYKYIKQGWPTLEILCDNANETYEYTMLIKNKLCEDNMDYAIDVNKTTITVR